MARVRQVRRGLTHGQCTVFLFPHKGEPLLGEVNSDSQKRCPRQEEV
jgi:hypothetical protein